MVLVVLVVLMVLVVVVVVIISLPVLIRARIDTMYGMYKQNRIKQRDKKTKNEKI